MKGQQLEAFPEVITPQQLDEWRREGRVVTGREDTSIVLCGKLIEATNRNALSVVLIGGLPAHRKSRTAKHTFNACGHTVIDGHRMHVSGDDFLGHERGTQLRKNIAKRGVDHFLTNYQRVDLACEVVKEILEVALSGKAKDLHKQNIYHKEGVHSGEFAPKTYHVPADMMVLIFEAVNALYQLDEGLKPTLESLDSDKEIEVTRLLMHAPVMQRLVWAAVRAILEGKATSFEEIYMHYYREYLLMVPLMQECANRADLVCDMPCNWEDFFRDLSMKAYEKNKEEAKEKPRKKRAKKIYKKGVDESEKLELGNEKLIKIFESVPADLLKFAFQGNNPEKFKRAA